ncbi:MAG: GTP-binding protein [Oscillospiraceae bacterium]|nr:GTP-binding protein [Oscillospiraceae bacterium]
MAFFEDSTVKILIISGFLGAGKTTFIQALASRTGRDFAVYENELGQRNIDGEALRREELSIWESTENCVCCTGQADLASAVLTISNALDPEYLVVEPSGAARLSGVLEAIGRVCYDRISLLRPITLVDSRSFASQRRSAQELWEDQVRAAGTILCTKGESLQPEEQARLAALLARRNPKAEIFTQPYSQQPLSWWERLLSAPCGSSGPAQPGGQAVASPLAEGMEQLTLGNLRLQSPAHLFLLLDDMVRGEYGQILRAKGTADCGNGVLLRFDLVDGAWNVTGGEGETSGVFIGKVIRRSRLRRFLLSSDGSSRASLREWLLQRT